MPTSLFPAALPETRARLERSATLRLANAFDWSHNPLGPIPFWPESLRGGLRVIMASSTPMVMMVGREGVLIYNDAYADFAGNRHPDIFGMPVAEAWPEVADFYQDKLELGLRGESEVLRGQELILDRHGHLESGWMDLHFSPILGDDGTALGTLCIVHETTDQVLAEKALARSEERMTLALSAANLVGTWDWDVVNDVVMCDDRMAEMYGIDPLRAGLGVGIADILAAHHPDDRDRVKADLDVSLADGSKFSAEHRVFDKDGRLRWVVGSGRPRLDASGRAVRFPGVVVDITEQHRASEALAESEMRFRTLADTMPQMVWTALPDGTHDYYNARWYEFIGTEAEENAHWLDIVHPDDRERADTLWRNCLQSGEPYQIEHRLQHNSGEYRWALGLALPVSDAQGHIVRWFGTYTDIHESKLVAEERELVAQELSHRIKNIFAVLIGIISLSARSQPEIKPFADQLRERIHAMGEAHDFVRPHGNAGFQAQGTLRALVERLVTPYREAERERITFVGEDATIDDGAATPLALLTHELATNAAKYGALSVAGGKVVVKGEADGDNYRLSWKEIGGPVLDPSATKSEGFGSRLITLSAEGQLRGKIERFWEKDGLRVEVSVPRAALNRSMRLSLGA